MDMVYHLCVCVCAGGKISWSPDLVVAEREPEKNDMLIIISSNSNNI